jgi:hypothetical protein
MATLLEEARGELRAIPSNERDMLMKQVMRLLDRPELREGTVSLSCGAHGIHEAPAVIIPLMGFEGGALEIALHHPGGPVEGEDASLTWCVTEPRSGLSCSWGFYCVQDALHEAMGKIALSIASEGRAGFEKRVATQLGTLVVTQ